MPASFQVAPSASVVPMSSLDTPYSQQPQLEKEQQDAPISGTGCAKWCAAARTAQHGVDAATAATEHVALRDCGGHWLAECLPSTLLHVSRGSYTQLSASLFRSSLLLFQPPRGIRLSLLATWRTQSLL
jgi:hypothetical protein